MRGRRHPAGMEMARAVALRMGMVAILGLLASGVAADGQVAAGETAAQAVVPAWSFRELTPASIEATPPLPPPGVYSVRLILDDDDAEGTFGIGGVTARQYLWFQQFSSPSPTFDLEEIWVLFPPDPQLSPGSAVQLAVYQDGDGDPTTGAELLFAVDEVVQVADGSTFSVYPLSSPVEIRGGGDVLIGVINRFVQTGVTPLNQPSALDTTASQGRSWVATWTGDPPNPPVFPPDESLFLIDDLVAGNWMIRGFGTAPDAVEIPTLSTAFLGLLALLLLTAGFWRLRRSRMSK